jgi:hypothetical protein
MTLTFLAWYKHVNKTWRDYTGVSGNIIESGNHNGNPLTLAYSGLALNRFDLTMNALYIKFNNMTQRSL